MPPKKRSPDDVHDIWNVEIGKPYRGQLVEKIDIETTNLDNGKVRVKRLIYLDNEMIVIEETWHEYEDIFVDGKLLPYNEIQFPSMDPADFAVPVGVTGPSKDDEDDDEKKKKRELLRQKAKDMLKQSRGGGNKKPPDTESGNEKMRISSTKDTPSNDPSFNLEDLDSELNETTLTVRVRTPEGKNVHVNVRLTDTVQALKDIIEKDHDIQIEDQNLSCNGKTLDDPDSTMKDNEIKHGDVIDLDADKITVNIRTPDVKNFSILVKPDDTVGCVKKRIKSDHGISAKNKKLSYEGKPLDDPGATMKDLGVSEGDTLDLDSDSNADATNRKNPMNANNNNSNSKGKSRTRILSPDSAWVYHTKASAPKEGEKNNLQGIWSTPPGKEAGTEPVEVNIHPFNKEPRSDGKADVHGAYGYINGAKPDADGVVDPANVVFYLPGQKEYSPDFEHVGWWSAPESSSVTRVSWRFVGDDILHSKTHTVNVMGHEINFVSEWTE